MPDPFDTLRRPDVLSPALPPAEVRRRGDRLRRRRAAVTAVGAAAAVVAVVTGGLLATGSTTGSAPQPPPAGPASASPTAGPTAASPEPSGGGATTVPAGFPLHLGLSGPGGDVTQTTGHARMTPFVFDPCHGTLATPAVERTDFAEVRHSIVGGQSLIRQLGVYADPATAARAFAGFRTGLDQCPSHDFGNGSVDRSAADDHGIGGTDESLVVVSHGYQDGRRTTLASHYVLARVGNAVLVVLDDGEFGSSDQATSDVDSAERNLALDLVAAMCPFSADGCVDPQARLTELGYGDLKIGMSDQEVATNPEVQRFAKDTGGACRSGTLVDGGRLAWSTRLGLVAIWLGGPMATPEGISLASTEAEVQRAYPTAKLQQGYWVVPLGSGLVYEFGFDADGSMSEGLLTSTDQDCFG